MGSWIVGGYPWIMLLVGLLGLAVGIDRTLKSRIKESGFLKALGLVGGIVMLALPILIMVRGAAVERITPLTLALMFLLGFCLTSRAMRRVPITFLIVAAASIGLFLLALQLQSSELGAKLPITIVAIVFLAVLGGVFAASLVFETALDGFLAILGWGPLVTVIAGVAAAQGLLIGAGLTGVSG